MKRPSEFIEVNAPVIVWYTAISFIVLLFGLATGNYSTDTFFTCYRTSAADPMMYVRILSYVFGHSDASHYINNFFLITLVGPMLEEKYGSKRLMYMMAVTAAVGGAVNVLVTANGLRGASGIAFMMIILCSCTSVKSGKVPLTMVFVVAIYIGKEILAGVTVQDNISQLTHILGGICGIVFGLYYNNTGFQKSA